MHRPLMCPLMWLTWSMSLTWAPALGCKPAEEPPRLRSSDAAVLVAEVAIGTPSGTVRVTGEPAPPELALPPATTAPPVIAPVGTHVAADSVTPHAEDAPAAVDSAAPAPDTGAAAHDGGPDGAAATAPARPEDLPAELLAALRAEVPQAARDAARKRNRLGVDAHKKLSLEAAVVHYRAALASFPAYPYARFNLACALALQKRNEEALFELAVLAHQARERGDSVARERLELARIEADFELLRDNARFRELTGATGVLVSWAGGVADGKKAARAVVLRLREARWAARAATNAWPTAVSGNAIRVRAGDAIAESAAKAIAGHLDEGGAEAGSWAVDIGAALPPEAPPIVVLIGGASGDAPPDEVPELAPEPSEREPGALTSLADALGRRLRAERATPSGDEFHQLELKSTGFFAWETAWPGGGRVRKSGRWSGGDRQLILTYKETSETPTPDGPPRIAVKDGLSAELTLEIGPQGLVIDGLTFR